MRLRQRYLDEKLKLAEEKETSNYCDNNEKKK